MDKETIILDLGCGDNKIPNAVGLDNAPLEGVDVVHDLLDVPYPFEPKAAQTIFLRHVIEHFELANIQTILRESFRILADDGRLFVSVPHVFSAAAWADPTHRMAFTFESGKFFDEQSSKAYYRELETRWKLIKTTARVTWFNWKRYRLRQLDRLFSRFIQAWLNWLLKLPNFPGSADLLVKLLPLYFVEISWEFAKTSITEDKDN